jgi:hypothetical protein
MKIRQWGAMAALCGVCFLLAGCPPGSSSSQHDFLTDANIDDEPGPFQLGGAVSGLAQGESLKLIKKHHEFLTVSQNGAFRFPDGVLKGAHYEAGVAVQPQNQLCRVQPGTGTIAGAAVDGIQVACETRQQVLLSVAKWKIDSFLSDAKTGGLTHASGAPYWHDNYSLYDFAVAPSGGWGVSSIGGISHLDSAILTERKLDAFSIDPVSGNVQLKPFEFPDLTDGPIAIGFSPTGEHLIGLQFEQRTALSQSIDPTTGSTRGAPDVRSMNHPAYAMAIDSSTRRVYSIDAGPTCFLTTSNLDDQTGAVTPNASLALPHTVQPENVPWCYETGSGTDIPLISPLYGRNDRPWIKVNPQGTLIFVSMPKARAIYMYALDAHTRLPYLQGTADLGEGTAGAVAVSPDGTRLYVSDWTSPRIFGFDILAHEGVVRALRGSPFTTWSKTTDIAIDASQTHLYGITNPSSVETFAIDPTTGALTQGASTQTVEFPTRIVFAP